ncbi:DHH family phosphoesterase [Kamptonema formosum]|uniref:DHH family phosphoesterase n=1 Tax=Kamptonema formosum TaxID=331992 RepID=UPI000346F7A7|nr:DHH family phosphoesterase [Oscillatoria sp. PCC 10802]
MPEQNIQWQIQPPAQPPEWFIQEIRRHAPDISGHYAGQLLWQRGIRDRQQLAGFLNPNSVQPASPFEFGQEMRWAVERLLAARRAGEKVAIWGDFDADGITATAVLWEGLGQFFPQHLQLTYYIPNRLTESHGLNRPGIDALAQSGTGLIVTCDTGSTNLEEIHYAGELGTDIIVTDHHTLPDQRPPVVAIINPRSLPASHQMANLSGVAVAYKLVEALYLTLPDIPQQPLENLLDLVAIGLIADLVQLTGESRYLAQQGIKRLQQQLSHPTRPGVQKLLQLCQRAGDRPTDISFGLGPRINAVSRIHGDSSFCVELLTSRDKKRCSELAEAAELANTRRQSLQKDVTQQVKAQLQKEDLSTTLVLVLTHSQWPAGVLGLVASQVAQEYGRPTVLLSTEVTDSADSQIPKSPNPGTPIPNSPIARGSARSVNNIDLYGLVKQRADLLHRFGGHPFAAGLALPVENIPLFAEAINRQLREKLGASGSLGVPVVTADLTVTVAELGQSLFRELKLLEPCGTGNPVPKFLVQNCCFEKVWHRNIEDSKGRKVQYIKTEFEIRDESSAFGFAGVWWGHYKEELPPGRCDAIVELDYNTFKQRYEVRLIAVRSCVGNFQFRAPAQIDWIVDWRCERVRAEGALMSEGKVSSPFIVVEECPRSWDELQVWFRHAAHRQQKLALAWGQPPLQSPAQIWQQLAGVAKYLSRTGAPVTRRQLCEKLGISDGCLQLGLQALGALGFQVAHFGQNLRLSWQKSASREGALAERPSALIAFLAAVYEEQFIRQYFAEVPLSTLQAMANSARDSLSEFDTDVEF